MPDRPFTRHSKGDGHDLQNIRATFHSGAAEIAQPQDEARRRHTVDVRDGETLSQSLWRSAVNAKPETHMDGIPSLTAKPVIVRARRALAMREAFTIFKAPPPPPGAAFIPRGYLPSARAVFYGGERCPPRRRRSAAEAKRLQSVPKELFECLN